MRKLIVASLAVAVLVAFSPAGAATIAFQAVADASSINFPGWTTNVGTGFGGGDVIEDTGGNTGAYASYPVTLPDAGTYYVYFLAKTTDQNGDGIFSDSDRLRISRAAHTSGVPIVNNYTYAAQVIASESWAWYNVGASVALTRIVVDSGEEGAYTWQVRNDSEMGQQLDWIVLSTDTGLNDAQLNALIPEPATLSLLAMGALAVIRRRRR